AELRENPRVKAAYLGG
ncbi:MAG: hypothetical protein ACE5F6_13065, partial [Anaerolineae bacterium]